MRSLGPIRNTLTVLDLPNVTLLLVATRGHALTRLVIDDCLTKAAFGDILLYTDKPELVPIPGARYEIVPDFPNKLEAGRFYYGVAMAKVETDFALLLEWDGGIFDATKWKTEFFDYDYIGAPWPRNISRGENEVGNGGFTLMSKRLGEFICHNRAQFDCTTDFDVCRKHRKGLERAGGFRWAPVDVAADFSWELGARSPNNFGYHGTFNWPSMMDRSALIARARAMTDDPYLLTKMPPLIRVAPWLQQELGAEAWQKYLAAQSRLANRR